MTDASAEAGDLSLGTRLVEAVEFFGLQATDDEMRWLLPISRNVSSFRGSMLGGCALAAVAAAGETWSGRPLMRALLSLGGRRLGADTLGSGMRVALGLEWRGASLDNTVRITGESHSEWVILDYEIDGFHNAVGHGVVRIFSPDGDLLATGSQSFAAARVGRSSPQFAV